MLKWPCRVKLRAVMGVVPQTKIISKRNSTKTKFQRLIDCRLWSENCGGELRITREARADRARETKATQRNGSILSLFTESEAKKRQKRSNKRTHRCRFPVIPRLYRCHFVRQNWSEWRNNFPLLSQLSSVRRWLWLIKKRNLISCQSYISVLAFGQFTIIIIIAIVI